MLQVRVCSSMQFIHRWSSVAYHTIILPFKFYTCIRACAIHHFYNPNVSILHSLALHSPPYRTFSSPMPYHARKSKLIMVHPGASFHPSKLQPYIPPTPAPLCCKCPKYCLLVVFHAAMYFSMQFVKAVCSEDEMEEPGLGMARSKQCSLTFCGIGQNVLRNKIVSPNWCEGSDWRHRLGMDVDYLRRRGSGRFAERLAGGLAA